MRDTRNRDLRLFRCSRLPEKRPFVWTSFFSAVSEPYSGTALSNVKETV